MIALDMDRKVRKPQFELDSEQVRYEHRFAPFNSVVTPPPVHYIQFKVLHLKAFRGCLLQLFYPKITVNSVFECVDVGNVRSEEVQSSSSLSGSLYGSQ